MQQDLEGYTVVKHPKLEVRDTEWWQNVEQNLSFDPKYHYEDCMTLDLGQENLQWKI